MHRMYMYNVAACSSRGLVANNGKWATNNGATVDATVELRCYSGSYSSITKWGRNSDIECIIWMTIGMFTCAPLRNCNQ